MQDQFRSGHAFPAATNAFLLDAVARFTQTRGVHEDDRQAADVGGLLDGVPRRAGDGRNDGAVVTE